LLPVVRLSGRRPGLFGAVTEGTRGQRAGYFRSPTPHSFIASTIAASVKSYRMGEMEI
jgi:hypothetical protein